MGNYLRFLKQKLYLGFLIVLGCAFLGAVRGAWKEEHDFHYIGVTPEDIAVKEQHPSDGSVPDLIGVIALAAEQNTWSTFSYAYIYAGRGVVVYCFLMAVYLPLYHWKFFEVIRNLLRRSGNEYKLFINVDNDI